MKLAVAPDACDPPTARATQRSDATTAGFCPQDGIDQLAGQPPADAADDDGWLKRALQWVPSPLPPGVRLVCAGVSPSPPLPLSLSLLTLPVIRPPLFLSVYRPSASLPTAPPPLHRLPDHASAPWCAFLLIGPTPWTLAAAAAAT